MKKISGIIIIACLLFFVQCSNKNITDKIIVKSEVIKLADDFSFTEGPTADKDGNVYFTDQPNNKIHIWNVDGVLSLFTDDSKRSNGLYFDMNGELLACADLDNKLIAFNMDKSIKEYAVDYNGSKLNGPNDLWIDLKGGVYFTDPYYQRPWWDRKSADLDVEAVYYLLPSRDKVIRVDNELVKPNGIIGSDDGTVLYVADIGAGKTYSYRIVEDGSLSDKKLFCSEGSDGMTIDKSGNVYLTNKTVSVFSKDGKQVIKIEIPESPSNVCFGGVDRKTLFITARTSLYSVEMNVEGF
ncbi:MAG: SMP-30/gluconolactonase/LRE family protein [Melioribacteraceae bacterium]|nr:SMP-30/gluconolactonase/LRE family protein [Melioribacteraceae bacterium]